jgi:hypothetical protein
LVLLALASFACVLLCCLARCSGQAAFGCAAVLLLAASVMLVPSVRTQLLKGKSGDAVTSMLVLCGYAFISLQVFLPIQFSDEVGPGGFSTTRRYVRVLFLFFCCEIRGLHAAEQH